MQVTSFKIPAKLFLWASVAVGATSADACMDPFIWAGSDDLTGNACMVIKGVGNGSDSPIAVYPGSTHDPAGAVARFGYPLPGNPSMPPKQIAAALKANEMAVFHDPRDVITDPVQQLFYPSEISGTSFDMKVAGTPPHDGPYAPWNKMVATFTQDLPERAGPSGPFLSIALNSWERDPMLPGVSFHYEGAASVFTDPRDIDITWTALEGAKPPPFDPSPTSPYPEGSIAAIDWNAAQTSMGRQAGLWWLPDDVPPICRGWAGPIPKWCLVAAGVNRGPTTEEWSTVTLNGFTPSIADAMIGSGRGDHIIPIPIPF